MNILDAEIFEDKVRFAGVIVCSAPSGFLKDKVKLGIRPEHVVSKRDAHIEFHTNIAEPLGANTIFHGTINNGKSQFTASIPGVHKLSDNTSTIKLQFPIEHCHLFDPDTLQRVN